MMESLPPISRMVRLIQSWPGCCVGRALVDVQADFLGAGEGDVARLGMLDDGIAEARCRVRDRS